MTSTDRERRALLRAVAEAPHDDLPRLAYADHLEEYPGEAWLTEHARFIRLQVLMSSLVNTRGEGELVTDYGPLPADARGPDLYSPHPGEVHALMQRATEMLHQHQREWTRHYAPSFDVPPLVIHDSVTERSVTCMWWRGFPWLVGGELMVLLEALPPALDTLPVTAVSVRDRRPATYRGRLYWARMEAPYAPHHLPRPLFDLMLARHGGDEADPAMWVKGGALTYTYTDVEGALAALNEGVLAHCRALSQLTLRREVVAT